MSVIVTRNTNGPDSAGVWPTPERCGKSPDESEQVGATAAAAAAHCNQSVPVAGRRCDGEERGGESSLPAPVLLRGARQPVNLERANRAMADISRVLTGKDELPPEIAKIMSMGPEELIIYATRLTVSTTNEIAQSLIERHKKSIASSIEANTERVQAAREALEKRTQEQQLGAKAKITKLMDPIVTGLAAGVTIVIGAAKCLTGNPTGLTDIASGVLGLVAAGCKVGMIYDPDNEKLAKAAMAFDMASMGLGMVGGVAGGVKSIMKSAATKIVAKAAKEAAQEGGRAALMATAIGTAKGAVGANLDNALQTITTIADDIGRAAAQKVAQQADEIARAAANQLAAAAQHAGAGAGRAMRTFAEAAKDVKDTVVRKWSARVLDQFNADLVQKTVSKQAAASARALVKAPARAGEDVAAKFVDSIEPVFDMRSLAAVSALEAALSATSGATGIWHATIDLNAVELRRNLAQLNLQAQMFEQIAAYWEEDARISDEHLETTLTRGSDTAKDAMQTLQGCYDVLMQISSSRA